MLILLAEDNELLRFTMGKQISSLGHEMHEADNGYEAALLATQVQYDLVLMDVHMPVMDGWDATRLIRACERETGRHTPIVAVTAIFDKENCLAAGMDDYLRKPVLYANLLDICQRYSAMETAC